MYVKNGLGTEGCMFLSIKLISGMVITAVVCISIPCSSQMDPEFSVLVTGDLLEINGGFAQNIFRLSSSLV